MAGFVRAELADRLASIASVLVDPVLTAVGDRSVVHAVRACSPGCRGRCCRVHRPPGDGGAVGDELAVPSYDAATPVGHRRVRRRAAG